MTRRSPRSRGSVRPATRSLRRGGDVVAGHAGSSRRPRRTSGHAISRARAGNSHGPKQTAEMTSISGAKMPRTSDSSPVTEPIVTSIARDPARQVNPTRSRQKPMRPRSTEASRMASIGGIFDARRAAERAPIRATSAPIGNAMPSVGQKLGVSSFIGVSPRSWASQSVSGVIRWANRIRRARRRPPRSTTRRGSSAGPAGESSRSGAAGRAPASARRRRTRTCWRPRRSR